MTTFNNVDVFTSDMQFSLYEYILSERLLPLNCGPHQARLESKRVSCMRRKIRYSFLVLPTHKHTVLNKLHYNVVYNSWRLISNNSNADLIEILRIFSGSQYRYSRRTYLPWSDFRSVLG